MDVAALVRNFEAILALQSVSRLHTQVWDRIIARTAAASTDAQAPDPIRSSVLFPHIARRRVRWTRLLAAQAVGRFGAFVWATLVVPFVTEVTRRASQASTSRPDEPFKAQHDRVQLELLLQQSRALVPHAVEAQVKLWERSPSLALLALTRPIGLVETFELWIDLVEAGHLVGIPHLASRCASSGCFQKSCCPPSAADSISRLRGQRREGSATRRVGSFVNPDRPLNRPTRQRQPARCAAHRHRGRVGSPV